MQKIITHLWFNNQAQEAAEFYVSIFPNSKITTTLPIREEGPGPHGVPIGVTFELDGHKFIAINGGELPFTFNETMSLYVDCETQAEIDHYWEKLSADPDKEECGWLRDKFGVSWQIIPNILDPLLADPNKEKASRVLNALLKMKKLDIAALQTAANKKV